MATTRLPRPRNYWILSLKFPHTLQESSDPRLFILHCMPIPIRSAFNPLQFPPLLQCETKRNLTCWQFQDQKLTILSRLVETHCQPVTETERDHQLLQWDKVPFLSFHFDRNCGANPFL